MNIQDLNTPTTCTFTGKQLDNTKIIANFWILKPTLQKSLSTRNDGYGRTENCIDYKNKESECIVVGTELQIYRLFVHMLNNYAWQLRDSFDEPIKDYMIQEYNNNNKIPVIL